MAIGFHWCGSWRGGDQMHDNLKKVHEAFPGKNLLFTDGCTENFDAKRYNAWGIGKCAVN